MSSHQRRTKNRYELRVKLLALFAWLRRRALAILKRRAITRPILEMVERLKVPALPFLCDSTCHKSTAQLLSVAVARLPEKAVA